MSDSGPVGASSIEEHPMTAEEMTPGCGQISGTDGYFYSGRFDQRDPTRQALPSGSGAHYFPRMR